jgi:magnesium-transporting ATPase (P-type)
MVTSVALGLVISFEPHELDVMQRQPRAVDRPILDAFGVWRVVFVGLALLVLTLWAFFWMQSKGASDELARAVAVNALVIGQIFYLLNSRYKLDSSLSLKAHLGNKYLAMGIGAVAILQLLFTYAPPFQTLFRDRGDPALGLAMAVRRWPRVLPCRRGGEADHSNGASRARRSRSGGSNRLRRSSRTCDGMLARA